MNVIYKQILEIVKEQIIQVPNGAQFLDVKTQRNQLCIWFLCDPENNKEERIILIYGTGNPGVLDVSEIDYLGTTLTDNDSYVWHVFEKL